MELIDVSFRESVYTDKIFTYAEVLDIVRYMVACNVDHFFSYLEFGYIDTKNSQCPLTYYNPSFIKELKQILGEKIKLSAMLHVKHFSPNVWQSDIIKLINMVRIVIDDQLNSQLKEEVEYFHNLGISVSLNYAYVSRQTDDEIINTLHKAAESGVDIFYIADTNGSMFPENIERLIIKLKKERTGLKIGFHAHNHFQLATANSLTAMKNGIDFLDTTVGGYGKGGGNLKTELIPILISKIKHEPMTEDDIMNLEKLVVYFRKYVNLGETSDFQNIYYAYKNLTLQEINELKKKK